MKLKRYYRLAMLLVLLCYSLIGLTAVSAEGTDGSAGEPVKLKYDFNEIKVIYAAEFLAYPDNPAPKATTVVSAVYKETVGSAVYGDVEPIHVLYGVVTLGSGGMEEEFIRVSQGNEFTRGLSSSRSWENFGKGDLYNTLSTEFLTGKTLEGKSVVKDYSAGWKTIKMKRTVDMNGDMKDISIQFNWNLAGVPDPFFERLLGKEYKVDIASLKDVGKQEVGP